MTHNNIAGKELAVMGRVRDQINELNNLKKLNKLLDENKSSSEICDILGITKNKLKEIILKLMYYHKKYIRINGLFLDDLYQVKIDENGDILLNTKMIDLGGININRKSKIDVSIDNNKIIIQIK